MREEELETAIKVVVVGNGAVGKSSMIQRYCKGIFTRDYKKTIGVDFLERQIEVNGEDVRLMLWDTAGQEEFDAITKAYYRGAQACVVAFSITDRDSFEAVLEWKRKVEDEVGEIATVLVQNKMDLIDESVVLQEEVDELCRQVNVRIFATSVKDNINIDEVFRYLAERYLAEINMEQEESTRQQTIGSTFCTTTSSTSHHGNHKDSSNSRKKQKDSGTISLQPSKRRTHGKKSAFSSFSKCTIL